MESAYNCIVVELFFEADARRKAHEFILCILPKVIFSQRLCLTVLPSLILAWFALAQFVFAL